MNTVDSVSCSSYGHSLIQDNVSEIESENAASSCTKILSSSIGAEIPNIATVPVNAAYLTYKSTITLYVGDGNPTGTNMKVGDHYNGNWYVAEIDTSHVKFGSQYGEYGNSFLIPKPEEIWTGVTYNYKTILTYATCFNGDANIGSTKQIIYTNGKATYKNIINTNAGTWKDIYYNLYIFRLCIKPNREKIPLFFLLSV